MKTQIFLQASALIVAVIAAPYPNERRDPGNSEYPTWYSPKVQVIEAEVKGVEARAANTKRYSPAYEIKEGDVKAIETRAPYAGLYPPGYSPKIQVLEAEVKEVETRAAHTKRYGPAWEVKEIDVESDA